MTPPPGFWTSPQIPNNTTSERSPMITTVFAATNPENTPFAYHASTSTNPNPMVTPTFVEANYEDYDEEREMEPRPEPNREATPTHRPRSHVVRRQRERVVGFEEAPNRERSRRGKNAKGETLSISFLDCVLPQDLTAFCLRLFTAFCLVHDCVLTTNQQHQTTTYHLGLKLSDCARLIRSFTCDISAVTGVSEVRPRFVIPYLGILHYHPHGGIDHSLRQQGVPFNTMGPMYPAVTPSSSFIDSTSSVTLFIRLIEDYLLDGLKLPSLIGSYDGKGDPDNFLHLFVAVVVRDFYKSFNLPRGVYR
ncbi:hypothetical protein Tco_1121418 [Tanacetum coccineum]|uniref:Uncharacterized protein n=1 Tax=Tanacetum coccineum TaxID=301880 RepID=A0ABQ5IXN0_9ASTR